MPRNNQSGISLFQGMFVLAALSVMFMSIAPMYYRVLGDRHVADYTGGLVGALQKARHLAIQGMTPVSLCSSNNGRECTQTPWSQGYIVFYDAGQPGVIDGNDRLVYAVHPRVAPIRVVLNGADHVRFLRNGGVLADASGSGQRRRSSGHPEQPSALASLLGALSPLSTANAAATTDADSSATAQSVSFLVCSGQAGRAIRISAIGRLDTTSVACY